MRRLLRFDDPTLNNKPNQSADCHFLQFKSYSRPVNTDRKAEIFSKVLLHFEVCILCRNISDVQREIFCSFQEEI